MRRATGLGYINATFGRLDGTDFTKIDTSNSGTHELSGGTWRYRLIKKNLQLSESNATAIQPITDPATGQPFAWKDVQNVSDLVIQVTKQMFEANPDPATGLPIKSIDAQILYMKSR